jgi:CBS domain-containing protein
MAKKKKINKPVRSFMTKSVVTLSENSKISAAAKLMAERSISCIVIVNKSNKPTGIITERDVVRRVLFANTNPKEKDLKTIMSSPVITVKNDTDIFVAMRLMQKNKIRRLVVTNERGVLIGLVTQTDIFRGIISLGT